MIFFFFSTRIINLPTPGLIAQSLQIPGPLSPWQVFNQTVLVGFLRPCDTVMPVGDVTSEGG